MKKPKTISDLAKMGGKARWKSVSKADRSDAMRKAVKARWSKRTKKP